jgi:hypothetical protein
MVNNCMREYKRSPQVPPPSTHLLLNSHPTSLSSTPVQQKFSICGMLVPQTNSGHKTPISNRLANRQWESMSK